MATVLTAREAALWVEDGVQIAIEGYLGAGVGEEILKALEDRFLQEGHPRDLDVVFAAGQGDFAHRGLNRLAHEGMIRRAMGGYWNLSPGIGQLALENKIKAYVLPQGVVAHMYRDSAAGRPTVTKVGMGTFVDPTRQGAAMNSISPNDLIRRVDLDGETYLHYPRLAPGICILKGSLADEDGNISIEHEGVRLDMLAIAQATKNAGGKVLVQVERVVRRGTLDPQKVEVPGILVDGVVEATQPRYQQQTTDIPFDPGICGQHRTLQESYHPLELSWKKVVVRRAAMELTRGAVVNLGIGTPEYVSDVAIEEGIREEIVLTVDDGPIGGSPLSEGSFGVSVNPECILNHGALFDYYHGGGLGIAFVGLAEADGAGNVNICLLRDRIIGVGGFIDLTQNAKKLVFMGSFTAGGLREEITQEGLRILQEGRIRKFRKEIPLICFSAREAVRKGTRVLYVTERAVFRLEEDGLVLAEIAPGVRLQEDILDLMEVKPRVAEDLVLMDKRLFGEGPMGLTV